MFTAAASPLFPAPQVELKDAAIKKSIRHTDAKVINLPSFFFDCLRCASLTAPRDDLHVLHPISLTFKPGRMCLVVSKGVTGPFNVTHDVCAGTSR